MDGRQKARGVASKARGKASKAYLAARSNSRSALSRSSAATAGWPSDGESGGGGGGRRIPIRSDPPEETETRLMREPGVGAVGE